MLFSYVDNRELHCGNPMRTYVDRIRCFPVWYLGTLSLILYCIVSSRHFSSTQNVLVDCLRSFFVACLSM